MVLKGIFRLGAPAAGVDPAFGVPDAVPVQAGAAAGGQPFAAGAARVDRKKVGGTLVQERVDQHAHDVVITAPQRALPAESVFVTATAAAVMGHGMGRDLRRFPVEANDADIEVGFIIHNAQHGLFARLPFRVRFDHAEIAEGSRRTPDRIIQATVDPGAIFDADRPDVGREDSRHHKHRQAMQKKRVFFATSIPLVQLKPRFEKPQRIRIVFQRRHFCKSLCPGRRITFDKKWKSPYSSTMKKPKISLFVLALIVLSSPCAPRCCPSKCWV